MAPKVHLWWLDHGWWFVAHGTRRPVLWITDFPIEEGRYWAALSSLYGVVGALLGTIDGGLTTLVSTTELVLEKYKVKKDLMLAPIPLELLLVLSPMCGLKELVKVWKNFPDELKVQREASIQKFKELTADEAYRACARYLDI